jgi:hypothetical protein
MQVPPTSCQTLRSRYDTFAIPLQLDEGLAFQERHLEEQYTTDPAPMSFTIQLLEP